MADGVVSPFELLANRQIGSTAAPTAPGGPSLESVAQTANQQYATAQQRFEQGPSGGRTGLAGEAAMLNRDVVQPVGSAISNWAKLMSDKSAVDELMKELETYGVDDATLKYAQYTMGSSNDPDKRNKVVTEILVPAMKQAKSAKKVGKILEDKDVQQKLQEINGNLAEADEKINADVQGNLIDQFEASRRAKQNRADALQTFVSTIYSIPGIELSEDDLKNVERMAKSLVVAQPKTGGAGAARGDMAMISWLKSTSAMGVPTIMEQYALLAENPTITKAFDPEYLKKYGELVPVDIATSEHFLSEQTAAKAVAGQGEAHNHDIIPVVNKRGQIMSIVRMGSSDGQNIAEALSQVMNAYIKANSGATVTKMNMMRYATELGLGELVKFAQLETEKSDSDEYSTDGITRALARGYDGSNRYINLGTVVQSLRSAMTRLKQNSERAFAGASETLRGNMVNYYTDAQNMYKKAMDTTFGNLELDKEGGFARLDPSSYTPMIGTSGATLKYQWPAIETIRKDEKMGPAIQTVATIEGEVTGKKEAKKIETTTSAEAAREKAMETAKQMGASVAFKEQLAGLDMAALLSDDPKARAAEAQKLIGSTNPAMAELASNIIAGKLFVDAMKAVAERFPSQFNNAPKPSADGGANTNAPGSKGNPFPMSYVNGKITETSRKQLLKLRQEVDASGGKKDIYYVGPDGKTHRVGGDK